MNETEADVESLSRAFREQAEREAREKQKYLKTKDFLDESKGGQGIKAFTWRSFVFSDFEGKPTMEWTVLIRTGTWKGQEKILTIYGPKAVDIAKELSWDFEKWKGVTMDATVVPGPNGKDRLILKKHIELE